MKDEINKALKILSAGGLILYPTDTLWGIGCDATNEAAVSKIFKLKGRDTNKSLIILLDTPSKLASYVNRVPDLAYDLIAYAENPLTIIYSGAKNIAQNLITQDQSIAIRIPKDAFCQNLIQQFRKPIVSTSANISGEESPTKFDNISRKIVAGVDHVVHLKTDSDSSKASTIIKLGLDGCFKFIRR